MVRKRFVPLLKASLYTWQSNQVKSHPIIRKVLSIKILREEVLRTNFLPLWSKSIAFADALIVSLFMADEDRFFFGKEVKGDCS